MESLHDRSLGRPDAAIAHEDVAQPPPLRAGVMTPAHILALQRTAGNAAVQGMLARQPAPPGPPGPRLVYRPNAHKALDDLGPRLDDFATAERRWLSGNYIEYYGHVSQNPRLSWGADLAYGAVSNTLGNAASLSVGTFLSRGARKMGAAGTGAAIGAAVGNLPGAALGFVLGVVIETAAGFLIDRISGKDKAEDRAAADASTRTAALIAKQEKDLDAHEDRSKAAARDRIAALRRHLDATADPKVVDAIWSDAVESARAVKKPSRDERGLMEAMLKEWVLEHAGDEEDANRETSEAQWEAARTRAFGRGDSLDKHTEIFAYQSRAHWTGLGLHDKSIVQSVRHIQDVERNAERSGSKVEIVKRIFDGQTFEFTQTRNGDAMIALIEKHVRALAFDGKLAIREGRFRLTAELDLAEADGAVYVDHWRYKFTFLGRGNWWKEQSLFPFEPSARFEVSPD